MISGTSLREHTSPAEADAQLHDLRATLAPHQAPVLRRSLGQIASTFLPFFGLIAAMYALRSASRRGSASPWPCRPRG